MAQQDGGKVTEGTRVRMKADGRVYVITKAYEEGGRDVYNGMLAELTSALAEDSGGFVGFTADAFTARVVRQRRRASDGAKGDS